MGNIKKAIVVLLLGMTVVAASCVPFGIAINNRLQLNEKINERILVNKNHQTSIFTVNTQHYINAAIKIHISSDEIHRHSSLQNNEYDAKFRFPLTLYITDRAGKKLYEYKGNLKWNKAKRSYQLDEVGSRHGEVIVEIELDKVKIPAPGAIKVFVLLAEDSFYYAKIQQARLIVYDNVHVYTTTILTGVGISVVGVILSIIGLVLILIKTVNEPVVVTTKQQRSEFVAPHNGDQQNQTTRDQAGINTAAMLCHLAALAGFMVPLGGILGPLLIWSIKKDDDPFIDRHGVAAINFHLSMFIYYTISVVLVFVIIGFLILPVLAVLDLIFTIIAAVRANDGQEYRYPLTIPFIRGC